MGRKTDGQTPDRKIEAILRAISIFLSGVYLLMARSAEASARDVTYWPACVDRHSG